MGSSKPRDFETLWDSQINKPWLVSVKYPTKCSCLSSKTSESLKFVLSTKCLVESLQWKMPLLGLGEQSFSTTPSWVRSNPSPTYWERSWKWPRRTNIWHLHCTLTVWVCRVKERSTSCHFWNSQGALCCVLQTFSSLQYVDCIQQLYQNERIDFVEYHGKGNYLDSQLLHQWHEWKCFPGPVAKCHLRKSLRGRLALALPKSTWLPYAIDSIGQR